MSRIGKKPIIVPGNCKVAVNSATREVAITGPKGDTLKVVYRPEVSVAWNEKDRQIVCTTDMTKIDEGNRRAFWEQLEPTSTIASRASPKVTRRSSKWSASATA
jgi:ribosomal protein L6P/L9E